MSFQATDHVLHLRGLTISEKAVAFCLACHARSDGSHAFPSMETLAQEAGLKHRQNAQRIVRSLERKNVIEPTSPKIGGRPGRNYTGATHYRFNLEKCNPPVAVTRPESATVEPAKCNRIDEKCNPAVPILQPHDCTNSSNKEEQKEKSHGKAPLTLITEKHGQGKSRENGNPEQMVREFFVWLPSEFPGLFLSEKQKGGLAEAIAAADYELPVLKEAARSILQDLDLSNSFERGQGRTALSANLLDACETARRQRKQRAHDQELKDAFGIRLQKQAEEERVKHAAERAEEEALAALPMAWETQDDDDAQDFSDRAPSLIAPL